MYTVVTITLGTISDIFGSFNTKQEAEDYMSYLISQDISNFGMVSKDYSILDESDMEYYN